MKLWTQTFLRLAVGTYFVLTSLYCLLAYLPYTFFFLIKSPPYAWMPWFVHHQAALYWIALFATLASRWSFSDSSSIRKPQFLISLTALAIAGVYVAFRPFLNDVESTRATYWWSLASLLPWLLIIASHLFDSNATSADQASEQPRLYHYSAALLSAAVISIVYMAGAHMRIYSQTRALGIHASDFEYAAWSLISHIALAVAVLSVVNLVLLASLRTPKPRFVRMVLNAALVFAGLWTVLVGFLNSALSFSGWSAHLYAASLALALTLWGLSLVHPFLRRQARIKAAPRLGTWTTLLGSCALALAFPYIVGDTDWSGFLQSTVTLLLWTVITICVYRLRPMRAQYSVLTVFAIILIAPAIYKGLQISEIFWSKPLGSTDDEISLNLEAYGSNDNSFLLAHHILGNTRHEVCGDLCRILRENSNIRGAYARSDVQLVDHLTATNGARPNIFVFVIDSMRPDYLGAYNPKVDYTPNLDAFARDSIVLHHAYSQYAGTSLSEPAIWSGAMMLHAHYAQPFSRLNSLDRLLHTDGYRIIVSADEILKVILPPDDDVVKLDTDKKLWNQLEIGSTLKQAEAVLDSRTDFMPVFLYAQPKNVHQFARNDVPLPASQHWPQRPELNTRITYEVHWVDSRLGEFFNYLKQHGLYDDSIIIVTSDHGDATGEFGRTSHSTCIWPEIMHVPLIVHLPRQMRQQLGYDDTRLSTLTDIAPTLYYLLGHKPILQNPLYGRPLFTETRQELESYSPHDLLLASDGRAVYGILTSDGRYLYTTYDSPAQSYLFDLVTDPNAQHNILTAPLKRHYDEQIIDNLHQIGNFYGYRPGVESLLASSGH